MYTSREVFGISARLRSRSSPRRPPSRSRHSRPSTDGLPNACSSTAIVVTHRRSGARRGCPGRTASPNSPTTCFWLSRDWRRPVMRLDEVLASLFPAGREVQRGPCGTFHGTGHRGTDGDVALIGIADGTPLGVEAALLLAGHVLSVVEQ